MVLALDGGLLLIEPNNSTFDDLMSSVEPFIQQQRYNTDMAAQGYLSAYFDHLGFTLPTTYNLNLAIKYQAPELWEQYIGEAVAIHYTWVKPWDHPEDRESSPASLWWTHNDRAPKKCK